MASKRIYETEDALMLYCPYDRKLTRHVRREPEGIVCLECGRHVETTAARSPGGGPNEATPGAAPHSASSHRLPTGRTRPVRGLRRPRPSARATMPMAAIAIAVVLIGVVFLVRFAADLMAPGAAPSESSATSAPAGARPVSEAPAPLTLRVTNTEGQGAFIRRTTSLEDRVLAWPDGTELKVIGPDVVANGISWKHVEDPAGNQGWIPAQYTETP